MIGSESPSRRPRRYGPPLVRGGDGHQHGADCRRPDGHRASSSALTRNSSFRMQQTTCNMLDTPIRVFHACSKSPLTRGAIDSKEQRS